MDIQLKKKKLNIDIDTIEDFKLAKNFLQYE